MEIIRLENGLFSINLSETENELVDELTRNLLSKLGNESPQTLLPRLFPEAILNEPELDSEYKAMTTHQLQNSHQKALEALNLLTSEKEISQDEFIFVIKGLNIIRLELGEVLDIDDESQTPPTGNSNQYRLWIVFQYLGQILSQCVEEFERNF